MSDTVTIHEPAIKETEIIISDEARSSARECLEKTGTWVADKLVHGTPAQKRKAAFLKIVAGVE